MPQYRRFQIQGAERESTATVPHLVGPTDPDQDARVTLVLKRPNDNQLTLAVHAMQEGEPTHQIHMTRDEFEREHSVQPETIQQVEAFARDYGLTLVNTQRAAGSVTLSGPVKALQRAFGVKMQDYGAGGALFHAKSGEATLPTGLAAIVDSIVGFDNRPAADPHFQIASGADNGVVVGHVGGTAFTPLDLARIYDFPTGVDGTGQTIAILELNVPGSSNPSASGGYRMQDLNEYFQSLSLPTPSITDVSVLGESNRPSGNSSGVDAEVVLDIEVAGAIAPGAKIVVYFAPNTKQGFLAGINAAIHDSTNKPSILSISWGSAEVNWSKDEARAFERAFRDAAILGVTILVAAGDGGSSDGLLDGRAHADFPGSAPHATSCGGTHLVVQGSQIDETVWNDDSVSSATGGGVSDLFDPPLYQVGAGIPPSANLEHRIGRGIPDLCADASPATGYRVRVDGQDLVIGGTSAVAPLCAGLIARINQRLGRQVGFINPSIYRKPNAFRDIRAGNNGAYQAKAGWDPCTGLGSLIGTSLANAL